MNERAHLEEVKRIAITALSAYHLDRQGWSFAWDRARRRFGCCNYLRRQITISKPLARINTLDACRDTVLHEIAHALAGRDAGHGPAWVRACLRVGARPERCYTPADVTTPPSRYVRYCPSCFQARPMHRRSRKQYACGPCCKKHNRGRYSEAFALRTVERSVFEQLAKGSGL